MTEKRPKTFIKLYELSLHRTIGKGRFSSFKQIQEIFNPMAINVQWISLTYEQLHFLY